MYIATIDCGTTNSRVYIVNRQADIVAKATKKVGVKDAAIAGDNRVLKEGIKATFEQALQAASLKTDDVELALSSGMITSEIGLLEIPHLWAPLSLDDLADHVKKVHDLSLFPVDIPIYFIPGVKNAYNPGIAQIKDVARLDFMRGEEVQVAGLLSNHKINFPATVVILSSHTKFISIDAEGRVLGSVTTMSGQIYEAIVNQTFIGKSIRGNDGFDDQSFFDTDLIDTVDGLIEKTGFLRSLMMPRFLDTLLDTKWYQRKLFVEAAIAAEDMSALNQFSSLGFPVETSFVIIGDQKRCRIYDYLLSKKTKNGTVNYSITDTAQIDLLSIQGALHIAEKAGII